MKMNTTRTEKDINVRSYQKEEDFMFFESLLAHVWKIPNERILSFRCKIQEIVEHFAYGNERSNAVGSKHP